MSEDLKTIAPEQEVTAQEQSATINADNSTSEETINYANLGLKEIVDLLQNLIDKEDVQLLYKHAEGIKAAFYKTLKREKIAVGYTDPITTSTEEEKGDDAEVVVQNPFAAIEKGFKELFLKYKELKNVYVQELNERKEENLAIKTEVISEIKDILDNPTDINKIYPKFRDLQAKWRSAGAVPAAKVKDLNETYSHYVERFYDYIRINNEIRELDYKKNLELKEALCAKAEALLEDENPSAAFKVLQKMHEEWKELGPVAKEYRDSIWERFRAASSAINKRHQEYMDIQKGNQHENLQAKVDICDKIEAIVEKALAEPSTTNWGTASKEIEALQEEWKKIGYTSRKDNQAIYAKMRGFCDNFYQKKREYFAVLKGELAENNTKKLNLCEQAEAAIENVTDSKAVSELLIDLQRQWKEIGPVSRNKSEQMWRRFRAACDKFFNDPNNKPSGKNSEFAKNLEAKRALIAKIEAYELSGDKPSDIEAMNQFKAEWNAIGYVPFKEKDAIQSAYQNAISSKFSSERGSKQRHDRNRGGKAMSEKDRLIQKYVKMEQDIATWENNMGFFSKSKGADALLKDLAVKIDAAKSELADLGTKIKKIEEKEEE